MKKFLVLLAVCLFAVGAQAKTAKNLIWVIGDGMGPSAVGFFMEAVRNGNNPAFPDKVSNLEKFINRSDTGLYLNNTKGSIVSDSACAATQMATGQFSLPDYIGQDYSGLNVKTIMEEAKERGMSVGVVTDVYVTDATPAAFLSHARSRKMKYDIARQMVASGADVIMGGGLKYFTQGENKKLLKEAKKQGYTIVKNKKQLASAKGKKILGLFADEAMPFYVEKTLHPNTPTLKDMAVGALKVLSKNPKGFILMVEAGKIDWALHENDAGASYYEMLTLDETLPLLTAFADKNEDTLVYLNADHETGAPAFNYRHLDEAQVQHKNAQGEMLYGGHTDYIDYKQYDKLLLQTRVLYYVNEDFKKLPAAQKTPQKFQEMLDKGLGYHVDISVLDNPTDYDAIKKLINEQKGLAWATGTHTSGMLLGIAYGDYDGFTGVYHNTDLKNKFSAALGWTELSDTDED